jgi:hypothetical protein
VKNGRGGKTRLTIKDTHFLKVSDIGGSTPVDLEKTAANEGNANAPQDINQTLQHHIVTNRKEDNDEEDSQQRNSHTNLHNVAKKSR